MQGHKTAEFLCYGTKIGNFVRIGTCQELEYSRAMRGFESNEA